MVTILEPILLVLWDKQEKEINNLPILPFSKSKPRFFFSLINFNKFSSLFSIFPPHSVNTISLLSLLLFELFFSSNLSLLLHPFVSLIFLVRLWQDLTKTIVKLQQNSREGNNLFIIGCFFHFFFSKCKLCINFQYSLLELKFSRRYL